jgi:RNA polymerase sigma-70 factor (ECF subfamily)
MTLVLRFSAPSHDDDGALDRRRLRVERAEPASSRTTVDRTDTALVAAIRVGDAEALASLMRIYYTPLVQFVVRYVGAIDIAEDIVQELFVRVWSLQESWKVETTCRSYLYGAARNGALKSLRGAQRRMRAEMHAAGAVVIVIPDGGALAEAEEVREMVVRTIQAMPERCRDVFLLVHDHGLSYEETAAALGIRASTVRTQLSRALTMLERALAPLLSS